MLFDKEIVYLHKCFRLKICPKNLNANTQDMSLNRMTPDQKALKINLDPTIYGSFAEIGAGQAVADLFFRAGAASGTIAKTMSAYDMKFSDAIYGAEASGRYVCESRLLKMISHEYKLCEERLTHRSEKTCFFAFANTVEVLNFNKTNKGHGWYGVRFQLKPQSEPNDLVVHVKFLDNHRHLQQEASGIIGVNMMYASYYLSDGDIEEFLLSLIDSLGRDRVEIDMVRLTGPDFRDVDNRLISLKLVKTHLANATIFGPDGGVLQASETLYKKNVLVLRGRFRPVTHVNIDMLEKGKNKFFSDPEVDPANTIVLSELTLSNLIVKGSDATAIDEQDFLDRVDILCSLGQTVLISNYHEYYRLLDYLSQFNRGKKIGIILGIYNLADIFKDKFYSDLRGGMLEAFGQLFGSNVKLYVYPAKGADGDFLTCKNFQLPASISPLFQYLIANDKFADLTDFDAGSLHIISDRVLELIKSGSDEWESMVPELVVKAIKEKCLFDYPCSLEEQQRAKERQKAKSEREAVKKEPDKPEEEVKNAKEKVKK